MKPLLNSEGKADIVKLVKLNEGVGQVRNTIKKGDIPGLVSLFKNVGESGMLELAKITTNACLHQAFLELSIMDGNTATRLQSIRNPTAAGRVACNTFDSKAQRLNECIKK